MFINYPVQGQECSLEATHFPGRQKVLSFILRSTEQQIIPSKVRGEAAHTDCNNRSQVSVCQPTFALGNNTKPPHCWQQGVDTVNCSVQRPGCWWKQGWPRKRAGEKGELRGLGLEQVLKIRNLSQEQYLRGQKLELKSQLWRFALRTTGFRWVLSLVPGGFFCPRFSFKLTWSLIVVFKIKME